MFRSLQLSPIAIGAAEETLRRDYRIVRAEHGWLLETTGAVVSVRRRLTQEVMVPQQTRYLLEDGDVLWGPGDGLILEPEPTHREPDLERRAVDDWNHTAHWGVLADRLLDHGDPLGERISSSLGQTTATPLSPHTWIGTNWRHGVLRRAAITRPEWASRVPWREALLELLCARSSRFLEELSLDLPRLEPDATPLELSAVARDLLALPWPPWLVRLHFGVLTDPPTLVTPQTLIESRPRLGRTHLFQRADRARLTLESVSDAFQVEGVTADSLELDEGLRVRVFPNKVLFERPVWPRYDSWPSWDFAFHDGRWFLMWRHGAPRSDDVKINGMEFFNAALVPGDRIEVMGHLVMRFELHD